jgi:hypothetical protein
MLAELNSSRGGFALGGISLCSKKVSERTYLLGGRRSPTGRVCHATFDVICSTCREGANKTGFSEGVQKAQGGES